jgi:hypothetical protein
MKVIPLWFLGNKRCASLATDDHIPRGICYARNCDGCRVGDVRYLNDGTRVLLIAVLMVDVPSQMPYTYAVVTGELTEEMIQTSQEPSPTCKPVEYSSVWLVTNTSVMTKARQRVHYGTKATNVPVHTAYQFDFCRQALSLLSNGVKDETNTFHIEYQNGREVGHHNRVPIHEKTKTGRKPSVLQSDVAKFYRPVSEVITKGVGRPTKATPSNKVAAGKSKTKNLSTRPPKRSKTLVDLSQAEEDESISILDNYNAYEDNNYNNDYSNIAYDAKLDNMHNSRKNNNNNYNNNSSSSSSSSSNNSTSELVGQMLSHNSQQSQQFMDLQRQTGEANRQVQSVESTRYDNLVHKTMDQTNNIVTRLIDRLPLGGPPSMQLPMYHPTLIDRLPLGGPPTMQLPMYHPTSTTASVSAASQSAMTVSKCVAKLAQIEQESEKVDQQISSLTERINDESTTPAALRLLQIQLESHQKESQTLCERYEKWTSRKDELNKLDDEDDSE